MIVEINLDNLYKSFFFEDLKKGIRSGFPFSDKEKKEIINETLKSYYQLVKDKPNVLSVNEIIDKINKSAFFSKNEWHNKSLISNLNIHKEKVYFGLSSGIIVSETKIYFIKDKDSVFIHKYHEDYDLVLYESKINGSYGVKISTKQDVDILKDFFEALIRNIKLAKEKKDNEKEQELNVLKNSHLSNIPIDHNDEIELLENDFDKLFRQNQSLILEIDKNYIHQFVKISNYLKVKRTNIQEVYKSIKNSNSQIEIEKRAELLKGQIHTYEVLLFHSLNLIGAISSKDLITFYEIYEMYDKVGIYNSNWENEISEKLHNIEYKLDNILEAIYQMEDKITKELDNLTYITQQSFSNLNDSLNKQLRNINSKIDLGNLLSVIQTYQTYKINKKLNIGK